MEDASAWDGNWAWSMPLIVLTVTLHVFGLGLANSMLLRVLTIVRTGRHFIYVFALVMGVATIWVTLLHGIEASIWAAAYRLVGALGDNRTAILYSLSAITAYGHSELFLAGHWRLMGALEALNGVLLIGLSTAFMYGVLRRVLPLD